ncbi:MAG: hypothetical protein JOZ46_10655 [Candidatus Dormibacteraeota bacterium]|nr:hypothetical protein [Candidatus Dormibacteraeota bacterium]MBV9526259.1 hypothetical protein [Candidatus Dormibacteraeota bacterium]
MSGWREVEVYGTFIKVTGELEILGVDRLSDSVNRYGAFLTIRNCRSEPLSVNYPVLSRMEPSMTVAKAGIILVCPVDDSTPGLSAMWREMVAHSASINTAAFALVGDVHLAPGQDLQDHLERHPGDFLPVTNLSALWITTITSETHALQRPFALLNPASILSFALR